MLPTLSVKCVATYSLEFVEKLMKNGVAVEKMTVHHFLQICKWSLQSNEAITKAQTKLVWKKTVFILSSLNLFYGIKSKCITLELFKLVNLFKFYSINLNLLITEINFK